MAYQTILFVSVVAGGLSLLSGLLITFNQYQKIKKTLEMKVARAEKELRDDIREIPLADLFKTKAGRELLHMSSKVRKFEKLKSYHSRSNTFIIHNSVYQISTDIVFRFTLWLTSFLHFVGILEKIGNSVVTLDKKKEPQEEKAA